MICKNFLKFIHFVNYLYFSLKIEAKYAIIIATFAKIDKYCTKLLKNSCFRFVEFVFEAMTGKVKFKDNDGTATHFLVVDFDGSADYHKVSKSTDPYVKKILPYIHIVLFNR